MRVIWPIRYLSSLSSWPAVPRREDTSSFHCCHPLFSCLSVRLSACLSLRQSLTQVSVDVSHSLASNSSACGLLQVLKPAYFPSVWLPDYLSASLPVSLTMCMSGLNIASAIFLNIHESLLNLILVRLSIPSDFLSEARWFLVRRSFSCLRGPSDDDED